VDLDFVLDIKAFDLNRVLHYDPRFLEMRPDRRHDPDIGTFCIVSADPLPELDAFRRFASTFSFFFLFCFFFCTTYL
jgi:hypothetical protein